MTATPAPSDLARPGEDAPRYEPPDLGPGAFIAERSLSNLADDIRGAWADTKRHQMSAWAGYLQTGAILGEARARFPANQDYGHWFDEQDFPFSQPTAWRLMELASRASEVWASIPAGMDGIGVRPLLALLDGRRAGGRTPESASTDDRWRALDGIARSIRDMKAAPAREVAAAVPERRRAGTARTLRELGTYLGSIALALEEMTS